MQSKYKGTAYHKHRAVESRIVGWGRCVDPDRCPSAAAHSCVVEIEKCSCGMFRETECNGTLKFRGRWVAEPKNWTKW
jgi:hypothetical protein